MNASQRGQSQNGPRASRLRKSQGNEEDFVLKYKMQAKTRPASSFSAMRRRVDLLSTSVSTFGQDAPKIAIGSSRREERPSYPLPGPGAYDPPSAPISKALPIRFPLARPRSDPPETSSIGFIDHRVFPEIKNVKIGGAARSGFFDLVDTPGPNFLPPTSLSQNTHLITNRTPIRDPLSESPGPGTYEPKKPNLPRIPGYVMSGPKRRDDWLESSIVSPGPGQYSPSFSNLRESNPCWSFGNKSRRSRRSQSGKKQRTVAIDKFIYKLDPQQDEAEAAGYIRSHPEIRNMVQEMLDFILSEKPENPVSALISQYALTEDDNTNSMPVVVPN